MENAEQEFDKDFWINKAIEYGMNDVKDVEKNKLNNNYDELNSIKIDNIDEYIFKNYCLKNIDIELLKNNKKKIFAKIKQDFPSSWEDNINLFILCLEENRLDLAPKFKINFNYDILKKYNHSIKHIIEIVFPDSWQKQQIFLDYLFENNYFEIIRRIDFDYLTEELLNRYSEKILFMIKEDFPDTLMYNQYLFEFCCNKNEISLLNNFYINNISQEILEKHHDLIISYIENNIDNGMTQYNSNLLEFCIKNSRNDLVSKFPSSTFTSTMLDKYKNVIFEILKKQKNVNTWNYDYNMFALCKKNNRNDLLIKFPKFYHDNIEN